jgi:hypothetical protein
MNTIPGRELINFFAECDNLRMSNGTDCSFDINYPDDRFEIRWGRNYETMEHEFEELFPFVLNQNIEISDKGVVKLITNNNSPLYFTFTKTLTLRDFR